MPYRTFLPDGAPTWLQDDNGGAWLQAFGLALDEQIDFIKQAIQARMPLIAPVDALGSIGAERQIDRAFFGDTDAEYRQRLFDAWETWTLAGTALGLLRALDDVNYVFTAEQRNFLEFALDGSRNLVRVDRGNLWDFGRPAGFWSIFAIIMEAGDIPAHWTNIQDPPTDVSAPTKAEVNFLRKIVRRWKPAKATLDRIIVITSGELWGFPSGGLWGDPGAWGATGVAWGPEDTP
jgi:hypothetical protein